MASSTIYQHRSLQPSGPPTGPIGHASSSQNHLVLHTGQSGPPARLNDAFDSIRQEFDGLAGDLSVVRGQRDEFEAKIREQVIELNSVRQSVYSLETIHAKIRQDYEEELGNLRAELAAARHGMPPLPGPSLPLPPTHNGMNVAAVAASVGGPTVLPGSIPPIVMPNSTPYNSEPYYGRDAPRDREMRDGRNDRDRDQSSRDHRAYRERDRLVDERDPKRAKTGDRNKLDGPPQQSTERGRQQPDPKAAPERPNKAILPISTRSPPPPQQNHPRRPEQFSPSLGPPPVKQLPPPPPASTAPAALPTPYSQPPPRSASTSVVESAVPAPAQIPVAPPPLPVTVVPSAGSETTMTVSEEASFLDDLDKDNVPAEFKNEGQDWWAIFNPKVKRNLDVTLVHTLTHESVVCCVRFSADGKYLATGCNRTAQIYDAKTGIKTCILIDESAGKTGDLYIRSVCFSPDGQFLATGAEDKQIRIWDIASKRIRNVFDGHQQEIYSLDFSGDGRTIVSGSGDKTARIWSMETGASTVLTINDSGPDEGDAGVTSVAISPDGTLVAAGSLDTIVRIWDIASGALIERLKGHRDSVYSVAFTPDGQGLVSGSLDKTLKYWDVSGLGGGAGGKKVANGGVKEDKSIPCTKNFLGHKDYVLSVAVSHDGRWVVSGSKDRGVLFWDSRTAVVQCMLQGHKNSVLSIDPSPTHSILATGGGDWQARIWSYGPHKAAQ